MSASVPSLDDYGSAKQRECLRVGWATVFFPESRNVYARMLNLGWVEAMRRILLGKGIYTYWNFSYRGGYDRSSGLRMDHLLIRPLLAQTIQAAGVDVETRGREKPSDHAPAWIGVGG
ncbi:hypothetical protein LCM4577_31480 [Mesorhizobium sp. LCM 4577]|nr:hypothetical protein LCM4577_31480 [Mesorhizobium sp. LCM 4577]